MSCLPRWSNIVRWGPCVRSCSRVRRGLPPASSPMRSGIWACASRSMRSPCSTDDGAPHGPAQGVDRPRGPLSACEELGRASIRYFALALGDENPLYVDDEYAREAEYPGDRAAHARLRDVPVRASAPARKRLNRLRMGVAAAGLADDPRRQRVRVHASGAAHQSRFGQLEARGHRRARAVGSRHPAVPLRVESEVVHVDEVLVVLAQKLTSSGRLVSDANTSCGYRRRRDD